MNAVGEAWCWFGFTLWWLIPLFRHFCEWFNEYWGKYQYVWVIIAGAGVKPKIDQ